jgi:hypothetical protein
MIRAMNEIKTLGSFDNFDNLDIINNIERNDIDELYNIDNTLSQDKQLNTAIEYELETKQGNVLQREFRKDIEYIINHERFFVDGQRVMYVTKHQIISLLDLFKKKYKKNFFNNSMKIFLKIYQIKNDINPFFHNTNIKYYGILYKSLFNRINYIINTLYDVNMHDEIYFEESHGRMAYLIYKMTNEYHIKKKKEIDDFEHKLKYYIISADSYTLLWHKILLNIKDTIFINTKKYNTILSNNTTKIDNKLFLLSFDVANGKRLHNFFLCLDKIITKNNKFTIVLNFYIENYQTKNYNDVLKKLLNIIQPVINDDYFMMFALTEKNYDVVKIMKKYKKSDNNFIK